MPMAEGRKRAVSLRVGDADLKKVKKLAQRLGARDSDVIRFALKSMLARLAPLCDGNARGRALLPVFMDVGLEMIRHFDLDGGRLNDIINTGAPKGLEIDEEDLQLIVMAGLQQSYAKLVLNRLRRPDQERRAMDSDDPLHSRLRSYLVAKYVTTQRDGASTGNGAAHVAHD
jgi:hypothetical protein